MENLAIEQDESTDRNNSTKMKNATQENITPIILYKRRWLILAIFSLISMMNEVLWISLSSISSILQNYYNVSDTSINWLAMIFSSMGITLPLSVYVLNRYGLKPTITIGAFCNALGSILRLIGHKRHGFILAFIGNIFGGIGQSFLIFIPTTLSAIWFGEDERARATSIGTLMNVLGVAVGFLMGSLFVPNSSDYDGKVKHGMFMTLLIQLIVCMLLLVVSIAFIRNHPPTPSSHTQALSIERKLAKLSIYLEEKTKKTTETIENQSTGFMKNWRMLLKNRNFHLLSQAYSLYFGMFVTVTTLLNQMTIKYFPGKEELIGIMGFTSTLCGIVSILLSGFVIDKTRWYKFVSMIIFIACIVLTLFFTFSLRYSGSFILTFISFCLLGFCLYPFLSVGLEYMAEIMYPIKESILSFILVSIGTIYGIAFTSLLGYITDEAGSDAAGYVTAALYLIGLVCVVMVKGELKRLNIDTTI